MVPPRTPLLRPALKVAVSRHANRIKQSRQGVHNLRQGQGKMYSRAY